MLTTTRTEYGVLCIDFTPDSTHSSTADLKACAHLFNIVSLYWPQSIKWIFPFSFFSWITNFANFSLVWKTLIVSAVNKTRFYTALDFMTILAISKQGPCCLLEIASLLSLIMRMIVFYLYVHNVLEIFCAIIVTAEKNFSPHNSIFKMILSDDSFR